MRPPYLDGPYYSKRAAKRGQAFLFLVAVVVCCSFAAALIIR